MKRDLHKKKIQQQFKTQDRIGFIVFTVCTVLILLTGFYFSFKDKNEVLKTNASNLTKEDANKIENGIHVRTGLIDAEGLKTVVDNCTVYHSSQLVIQNRMNKETWNATIRWMQETQNLWPLGEKQEVIVDYLVKNYPPIEKGRRANLEEIEWYPLEN